MPRGNPQNLKPNSERTAEEVKALTRKGGVNSGKTRRKKRDIRLAIEALLERKYYGKDGKTLSGAEAIALKQMEKALKGDTRAFEVVRDTAGQKPVERIIMSEVSQDIIDEVERAVYEDD